MKLMEEQLSPTPPLPPQKPNYWIWIGICVVMLALGIGIGLFFGKNVSPASQISPAPTPLPDEASAKEVDPTANWKIFTSQRADLSFQYPPDWPVNQCSVRETYQFDDEVEHVDFAEDCIPNATSQSFGFVIVKKVFGYIKNPADYIQERESGPFDVTTVTSAQVGNTKGYMVINQPKSNAQGNLSPEVKRFYIIKDYSNFTLVYLIGLTNPGHLGWEKEKGIRTFDQILSTFKFLEVATPRPTCKPRPACLDATPRCMIAETSDMCPPNQKL